MTALPNPFQFNSAVASATMAGSAAGPRLSDPVDPAAANSPGPVEPTRLAVNSAGAELPSAPAAFSNPVAKATEGKAGMAGINGPVRRSTAGTGLQVGEASADLPTTSEFMDVTGRRDAHTNSELSLRRANASDVLSGAHPVGPGRKTGSDLANVPAVETLANLGVTAGETAPNSSSCGGVEVTRGLVAEARGGKQHQTVPGCRLSHSGPHDSIEYDTSCIPDLLRALNAMNSRPVDLDALRANLEKIDDNSYPQDREELRFIRGIDPIYYDVPKPRTPFLQKYFGSRS